MEIILGMKKSVINDDYSKIYLCYIPSNRNGHCFYNNIYDNSFSSVIDFENIVWGIIFLQIFIILNPLRNIYFHGEE